MPSGTLSGGASKSAGEEGGVLRVRGCTAAPAFLAAAASFLAAPPCNQPATPFPALPHSPCVCSMIRRGDARVMVAGGTESCVDAVALAGFSRLKALTTRFNDQPGAASRPFDAGRDGFVMGEGAGGGRRGRGGSGVSTPGCGRTRRVAGSVQGGCAALCRCSCAPLPSCVTHRHAVLPVQASLCWRTRSTPGRGVRASMERCALKGGREGRGRRGRWAGTAFQELLLPLLAVYARCNASCTHPHTHRTPIHTRRPLLQVRGCGMSGDAHHITQPPPDGAGAQLAMRRALAQAGLAPSDICYINAHATSTPQGGWVQITSGCRGVGVCSSSLLWSAARMGAGKARCSCVHPALLQAV